VSATELDSTLDIFEVPEGRRYWVVRADAGRYYDHFISDRAVAIGRLDHAVLPDDLDDFLSDEDRIESVSRAQSAKDGLARQTATLHFNQLSRFLFEISVGDWLITMGRSKVRFGRVVSKPYVDVNPVVLVDESKGTTSAMPYRLRRNMVWGPTFRKADLPSRLVASLQAHQTIFNVDKSWEAIHQALYPVFRRGESVYLSARIRSDKPIANIDLTNYLTFLSELEYIAKRQDLSSAEKSNQFQSDFQKFVQSGKATLSTKASFQSVGEIAHIFEIILSNRGLQIASIIYFGYAMLFGNRLAGMDGLMPTSSREELWSLIIKRMDEWSAKKIAERYEMQPPTVRTDQLEDAGPDEQPARDENLNVVVLKTGAANESADSADEV